MERNAAWIVIALALAIRAVDLRAADAGTNGFFAFCMDTHDEKKRSLQEQAKLLAELGYDGAGHLWLEALPERLKTLDAAGLKLFQVYVRATLEAGQPPYDPKLKDALPLLTGRGAMIALLMTGAKPSDAALDERGVKIVAEIADMARPHGVRVALYPHAGDWLERTEDAVRVARKVARENVGVMFNLCHWLRVDEEKNLRTVLEGAKPYLVAVSINGADHAADIRSGKGQMILPLGKGAFDVEAVLRVLNEIGYRGPVGLQCWGLPGDARLHLTESIQAWKRMKERVSSTR